MKKQTSDKWYKDWSWLGYVNFYLLQWFFIRLAMVRDVDLRKYGTVPEIHKWKPKILKWIKPLTGWWSDYVYLNSYKHRVNVKAVVKDKIVMLLDSMDTKDIEEFARKNGINIYED